MIQTVGPFAPEAQPELFCGSVPVHCFPADFHRSGRHDLLPASKSYSTAKLPTPERVAGLKAKPLRAAGLSRQKAAYLKDLSHRFIDGTIRPHRLNFLGNEEIIDQLTQVHGIGRWTAEMFLIFSLNRLDVLPVDDLGLRVAVQNIYGMKTRPDAKRLRAIGKKWNPLESVATWYAWRSLNANIVNY